MNISVLIVSPPVVNLLCVLVIELSDLGWSCSCQSRKCTVKVLNNVIR